MFVSTMTAAIEAARTLAQMDGLSRDVWRAHASGAVDDDGAQRLAELLHVRRRAVRETIEPVGIPLGRATLFPPRRAQRSPDRAASRERRRRLACAGPLPPQLGMRFTTGQLAVLKVVGDEVAAKGVCGLCLDAIAARAGVCRRLAQATIRLAEGDGLITVQERRREGRTNETNLVRVISREWQAWLRRGRRSAPLPGANVTSALAVGGIGCKTIHPTDRGVQTGENSGPPRRRNAAEGQRSPVRARPFENRRG